MTPIVHHLACTSMLPGWKTILNSSMLSCTGSMKSWPTTTMSTLLQWLKSSSGCKIRRPPTKSRTSSHGGKSVQSNRMPSQHVGSRTHADSHQRKFPGSWSTSRHVSDVRTIIRGSATPLVTVSFKTLLLNAWIRLNWDSDSDHFNFFNLTFLWQHGTRESAS